MKSFLLCTLLGSALCTPIIDQVKPADQNKPPLVEVKSKRKIQLVILFDTSSSMNGLLNQAKSRLWEIVNESGALRYHGEVPSLEIAMYDYGNSGIQNNLFVRKQLDFTSDLDLVSQKLFALTTNGGNEYCGAVISDALAQLNWSSDARDLKMVYIAGNEPFNQGPVNYQEVCSIATSKEVLVNTIYCGDHMQGIREMWKDGASCAKGDYFNIDANREVVFIPTPFDDQINEYSMKINRTYVQYNSIGMGRMELQESQDMNAAHVNASVAAKRAKAKISLNYNNSQWDLIDAYLADSTVINSLDRKFLSDELKDKTNKELHLFVKTKLKEREDIQNTIADLTVKREAFIQKKKQEMNSNDEDDLGTAINNSILNKAISLGFDKHDE
jgi:hypothetical protein